MALAAGRQDSHLVVDSEPGNFSSKIIEKCPRAFRPAVWTTAKVGPVFWILDFGFWILDFGFPLAGVWISGRGWLSRFTLHISHY